MTSYLGLTLFRAVLQRSYIYHPRRMTMEVAEREAVGLRREPWRDGLENLMGWTRRSGVNGAPRVLIFHSNAGSAVDRHYYA